MIYEYKKPRKYSYKRAIFDCVLKKYKPVVFYEALRKNQHGEKPIFSVFTQKMTHLHYKISKMLHIPEEVVKRVLEEKEKNSKTSSERIASKISKEL